MQTVEDVENSPLQQQLAPVLTPVDQFRVLSITVSSDLSWTSHIQSSGDRARKMAAWVFSVFHTRNTGVMSTLNKSLVRSHIDHSWFVSYFFGKSALKCG